MEKDFEFVIGMDVSKKTIDVCLNDVRFGESLFFSKFSNSLKGYDKMLDWLKSNGVVLRSSLFCLENTGMYHRLLVSYLQKGKFFVWVETPVQIKWSSGIQRGKSDLVDCERIMRYAYKHRSDASPYESKGKSLDQISDYLSLRERMQDCLKKLRVPIKEMESVGLLSEAKKLYRSVSKSIRSLEKELLALDEKIRLLIEKDEDLKEKYAYATSVTSIGYVAGVYLLVYTNGFTRFKTPKQLASFAGVAPFEYSSGSSVRGRTRVHFMANKKLKTVLHMCAVSSLRNNEELKAYFKRKVSQGKNKMSVINAIRNKLLSRVFSCVKNERMYVKR